MNSLDTKKIRLLMQLRRQGITDSAVLGTIERTPRERFVPPAFHDQAYEDTALPIGLGQTISQPGIVATMTQALELNDRCKVLEVGTGSGYQTAILSKLCRRVYTVERHRPLLQKAEEHFTGMNLRNITALCADGMKGWPQQAPFDRIIVTAAAFGEPPPCLLDQLAIGGLMVIPVGRTTSDQILRRYKREGDDVYAVKDLAAVRFVPLLPDISGERKPEPQTIAAGGSGF